MKSMMLLLLFCLLLGSQGVSQGVKIDSLLQVVTSEIPLEQKAMTYHELAIQYQQRGELELGLNAAIQSLSLANRAVSSRAQAYANYALAAVYEFKG